MPEAAAPGVQCAWGGGMIARSRPHGGRHDRGIAALYPDQRLEIIIMRATKLVAFACLALCSSVAFAAAKDDVHIVAKDNCGDNPVGAQQVLVNSNSSKAVRAKITTHAPHGQPPDPRTEERVPAGGQVVIGCSSNGDGGLLTFTIVGADYAEGL